MSFKAGITNSAQNLCGVHEACSKLRSNFTENSIMFSGDRTELSDGKLHMSFVIFALRRMFRILF